MASLNVESLRRKLHALQNTQDSIATLSLWIIHHKNHYRQIVEEWVDACRNMTKSSRRLTLLYLANDVLQNSKRKGATVFLDAFAEVLEEAASLCRDEAIRKNLLRIFNIWEERNIYENDFCEKLLAALVHEKKAVVKPKPVANTKILAEYKPKEVPETIEELMRFEAETELKCKQLNNMTVDVTNTETITKLKDRAGGKQFSKQFDEAATKLEDYVNSLTKEVEMRRKLAVLLDNGEIFYEAQNSEAKIVTNAYKNFNTRVSSLKKRLDEYKKLLPDPTSSPLPSPGSDAPSPGATPPRDTNFDTVEVEDMELSDEDSKHQAAPVKSAIYKPTSGLNKPMPALPTIIGDDTPPGSPPSPEGSPIALSPPSLTPPSLTPPDDKKKKKRSHKHRKDHKRDYHHHKRSRKDRKHSASLPVYTPSPKLSPEPFSNHFGSKASTPSSKSDSKGEERVGTPLRDEVDSQQNKEKLIKEATTNPIEFLTKLISKSQQSKGKKSAQSTSFINSLTVLSKNVKRLEAAKQAETNFDLHKTMPLESPTGTTTLTTTPAKSKSPVASTSSSVLPFSVSTVSESVEDDKFKDHLAAHAMSVGHIMKALKDNKPPPPPPPPASTLAGGGFGQATNAPLLFKPASTAAPVSFTPGQYKPVTSAPGGFPPPANNDVQIVGEKLSEVQMLGINLPPHATGLQQAPAPHITGVPPPSEQPLRGSHPVGPAPQPIGSQLVGPSPQPVGPPQPVPAPVAFTSAPITPTHSRTPPFSTPNVPFNQASSYRQPSPGPSPGPSPEQQRPPPFPDQPIRRPPPDQNMEPLFPQRGPPPNQIGPPSFPPPQNTPPSFPPPQNAARPHIDIRPSFPDLRSPSPNQDIRPPFSQQNSNAPFPNLNIPSLNIRALGPLLNQVIRPPFSPQNSNAPYPGPNVRALTPSPNQDIRPPFSHQNTNAPFVGPNIRAPGPLPNQDIRPPFSQQNTNAPFPGPNIRAPGPLPNQDIRPPFSQQNTNAPFPGPNMRAATPSPSHDISPPFSQQNAPFPFSGPNVRAPIPSPSQDIRPPFSQQNTNAPFPGPNIQGPPPNRFPPPNLAAGPPPNVRPPFPELNIRGPPPNLQPPFNHGGPQHGVRAPYPEHGVGGPPADQDMRVPFPHQENQMPSGDKDMRTLFPHQDNNRPPQDQDMRSSFPPPHHSQRPSHAFDQDMRQPYNPNLPSGDQDMRQPYPNTPAEGQRQDMDLRQRQHQHSAGEEPYDPEQGYDLDQPYDPGQSVDHDQSYTDQSITEPLPDESYSEYLERYNRQKSKGLIQPDDVRPVFPQLNVAAGPPPDVRGQQDNARPVFPPPNVAAGPPPDVRGQQDNARPVFPPPNLAAGPPPDVRGPQDSQHYKPLDQYSGNPNHINIAPPVHGQHAPDHYTPPSQDTPPSHEQYPGRQDIYGGPQSQQPYGGSLHHSEAQPIQSLSAPAMRPRSILKKRKPDNIISDNIISLAEEQRPYEDQHRVPPHAQNLGAPLPFHLLHAPPPPPEEPDHSWPPSHQGGPPSVLSEAQPIKVLTSSVPPVRMQKPGPPPGPPPLSAKRLSGAPPPPPGPPPANARRLGSMDSGMSNRVEMTEDELTELAHLELEQALEMSDSIPKIKPSKTLVQIPITFEDTGIKEPPALSTPPLKPALKSAMKKDKFVPLPAILKSALKKVALSESQPPAAAVQEKLKPKAASEKHESSMSMAVQIEMELQELEEKMMVNKATVPDSKQKNENENLSKLDMPKSELAKGEPSSPIPVLSNKKPDGQSMQSPIGTPPGFRRHSDDVASGDNDGPENMNVHSIETVGQRRRSFPDRPFDRHRDNRFEGNFNRNFDSQYGRHNNRSPGSDSFRRNNPMNRQVDMFEEDQDYRQFDSPGVNHDQQFGRGPPPKRPGPPMMGGPPARRQPPPFYRY